MAASGCAPGRCVLCARARARAHAYARAFACARALVRARVCVWDGGHRLAADGAGVPNEPGERPSALLQQLRRRRALAVSPHPLPLPWQPRRPLQSCRPCGEKREAATGRAFFLSQISPYSNVFQRFIYIFHTWFVAKLHLFFFFYFSYVLFFRRDPPAVSTPSSPFRSFPAPRLAGHVGWGGSSASRQASISSTTRSRAPSRASWGSSPPWPRGSTSAATPSLDTYPPSTYPPPRLFATHRCCTSAPL